MPWNHPDWLVQFLELILCRILPGDFMKNDQLFVEKRPQGDFAVRKGNSERASAVEPT